MVKGSLQVGLDPLGVVRVHVAISLVGTIGFEVGETLVSPALAPGVLDLPEGTLIEEGFLLSVDIVHAVSWVHIVFEFSRLRIAWSFPSTFHSGVQISNLDSVVSTLSYGVVSNHSHLMVSSTARVAISIA